MEYSMKINELLKAVALGTTCPDRPFLMEGLTFGQVYGQAEAIKIALDRAGCTTAPVCLCSDDRGQMAAAMLAAMTGGPPLLFPYAYTEHTLMEAHQNVPFSHALVQGEYQLPAGVRGIPMPDTTLAATDSIPLRVMEPDATWIYLFTGGSTGSPRIWSKSPRNLLLEAANLAKAFKITSNDVILASVAPNHIYGLLYSVLLPLISGACVSYRTPSFPGEIIQAMEETKATVFVGIPAHYRALKAISIANHRIHTAFSSAGALSEQDDRAFFDSTGIAVLEIYGSTETGGIAFRQRGTDQCSLKPFSYVDIKIEGERLYVRSDFLSDELRKDAKGYFLTTDRVTPADRVGFEVLGRFDGIIKVGGKRVDLANIRQVIADIPDVEDVYVFAVPVNSSRENEVIAIVAGLVDVDQVIKVAKKSLPPYALPRRVKVVDQIPLSAAGKYNRDAIEKIMNSNQ